jgi:hypothetical protein
MDNTPIDIGSRLELLTDGYLIDRMHGASLVLNSPAPQEVSIVYDKPWEGNTSGYETVLNDGGLYRMYYRGSHHAYGDNNDLGFQVTCYAESTDGIHWEKPSLGLVEYKGSTDNNIIWEGVVSHNLSPVIDRNPGCAPDAKFKALGGTGRKHGLYALKSADGIRWSLMSDEPVITDGAFDSQNLGFWDVLRGEYRVYHRDFRDGRDIKTCTSQDFVNWTEPEWVGYSPGRGGELYTNQVEPYYRAPHIFVGFPTRYFDRGWIEGMDALPQPEHRRLRAESSPREGSAVTEGMFMSSRDAMTLNVWPEAFLRPGLRDRDGWFYGDNYQSLGLVETESTIEGATRELSLWMSEGLHQADRASRLRRYTIRIDGFVSAHADYAGGEFVTRPVVFEGSELVLNVSTSAAGGVNVEIQDDRGIPIEGFSMSDCHEVFGDSLERTVTWGGGKNLGDLAGKTVRLRFLLKDADLYSLRFR